jgi:RNA polymerase sigma factor (sigma-70 family)
MVLGVCRRLLRDSHEVEDAFQATFLVLCRQAASLRRREALGGWLHRVASNVALKARAQAARHRSLSGPLQDVSARESAPELDRQDLRPVLDEELSRLPERYRAPVVLCYLEGKTVAQAACELGWPHGTVASRLARARERLHTRLTRRGVTLPAAGLAALLAEQAGTAAVSASLAQSTTKVAALFALGQAAVPGAATVQAVLLAQGVLHGMLVAKLKTAAVAVVLVGLLGVGVGVVTHHTLAQKPTAGEPLSRTKTQQLPGQSGPPNADSRRRIARTDQFGDSLPDGAVARLGTVRFRAAFQACVAFSPDGVVLAWGDTQGRLVLCDPATGKELRSWTGHSSPVHSLAFSPDGKRLFSAGHDAVVRVWDTATAREVRRFEGGENANTRAVALSPDGSMLVTGDRAKGLRLWDTATGQEIRQLRGHAANVWSAVFSPGGKYLASTGDDKTIRLWKLSTGEEVGKFESPNRFSQLLWLPDDKTLLSKGEDGKIWMWDTSTGKPLGLLGGREEGQKSVASPNLEMHIQEANLVCSPDGQTLITSSESEPLIRVWDLKAGRAIRTLTGDLDRPCYLALSPDGKMLAAGCRDGSILLWDVATGQLREPNTAPRGRVFAAHFSPDGKTLVTGGEDSLIHLWETTRWTELRQLADPDSQGQVWGLAFSADGKALVSGFFHGEALLWDWTAEKVLCRFTDEPRRPPFQSVALSPDGKLFTTNQAVWDAPSGQERYRFAFPVGYGPCLHAFTPDGRILAVGSLDTIQLCEPLTGKVVRQLKGHQKQLLALAVSSDGKQLVSSDAEGRVRIWDLATGRGRGLFTGPANGVYGVALSPDGKVVASASGNGARNSSDHVVTLWEVATGKERRRFPGHRSYVYTVTFSPDGNWLVSPSYDSSALVWDVTGQYGKGLPVGASLPREQAEALWAELGDADAGKAYRALGVLIANPQFAVPLVRERLRPVLAEDASEIRRLVADLDGDRFAVRQNSEQVLAKLGAKAEGALRQALKHNPPLQVRKSVEALLDKLDGPTNDPGRLRELRAVEVLEHIDTAEARTMLASLTRGAPEARLTQEAKASLERLARRETAGN